jgi:hypothetical protein
VHESSEPINRYVKHDQSKGSFAFSTANEQDEQYDMQTTTPQYYWWTNDMRRDGYDLSCPNG